MDVKIYIHNGAQMLSPEVQQGVTWETERKGMPGKLSFSALQDGLLDISEGNTVLLHADGKPIFSGYLFRISRSEGETAKLTAYDQLRYLKNKDTYSFEGSTASERIRMIAGDYGIRLGEIADTAYKLPPRIEDNSTLLDMMQTALESTLTATRQLYVLYDDAGALTLKNAADMHIGLMIDAQTAQGYAYESGIDDESYNRVKLARTGKDGEIREVFIAEDAETQKKWGTLQLFETINDDENAQNKADMLLALYNSPKKSLRISGVLGDLRVRAGCFIIAALEMPDRKLNNFMLVEKCTHRFDSGLHTMDLTLKGGAFNG